MPASRFVESRSLPIQRTYEESTGRFTVVVDVFPATIDDLAVRVSSRRARLELDHPWGTFERSFRPPEGRAIADGDRRAVFNNGVLRISVPTDRDERSRSSGAVPR